MVKPEWGVKRTCQSCGVKFYDMTREPIVCPKCGTVFDFEAALKSRKVRTSNNDAKPAAAKKVKAKAKPIVEDDLVDAELEDIEDVEDVEDVEDDVLPDDDDTDDTLADVVVVGAKRKPDAEEEEEDLDLDDDDDDELLEADVDDDEEEDLDVVEDDEDEDRDR